MRSTRRASWRDRRPAPNAHRHSNRRHRKCGCCPCSKAASSRTRAFVDKRPVAAAEVLDEELVAHPHDLSVVAADGAGIHDDVAVGMAAKHGLLLVQLDLLTRLARFSSGEYLQFRHPVSLVIVVSNRSILSHPNRFTTVASCAARRDLTPISPGRTLAQWHELVGRPAGPVAGRASHGGWSVARSGCITREWCNWQHIGFWFRHSRFES